MKVSSYLFDDLIPFWKEDRKVLHNLDNFVANALEVKLHFEFINSLIIFQVSTFIKFQSDSRTPFFAKMVKTSSFKFLIMESLMLGRKVSL